MQGGAGGQAGFLQWTTPDEQIAAPTLPWSSTVARASKNRKLPCATCSHGTSPAAALYISAGSADLPNSATPRGHTSRRHWSNPLEVIASIASRNAWPLHDAGEDELALAVEGNCADYQVFFTWMSDLEVFHLACIFEMKVPEQRRPEVQRLIACINEQLWLGHFDLWMEDGTIVFRQSLLLVGGVAASVRQCEVMLGAALDACERYHPAFRSVMAAETAGNALAAALFETVGEA